jgi:putative membrane-bound dehydrogenase-like protein
MNFLKAIQHVFTVAVTSVFILLLASCAPHHTQSEKVSQSTKKHIHGAGYAQSIANQGDRDGHVMKDVIPKEEVPPAPILSVADALNGMRLQKGFVLENIVSEPNVFNPVAAAFDADGRMWICEMTRYMPDIYGNGEELPEGNIVVLEDTTGDGVIDKRTVFLNDIVLPRTISLVKGGIVYADHTQLYFTEVLPDLTPGIREVIDPNYAKGGSLEHKTNTMLYGFDNWYYNAKSDKKYQFLPLNVALPGRSKELYRNKYWKAVLAKTDYRGQWGLSTDDYGRLYHNGNSSPIQGEYLRPGALLKNTEFYSRMKAKSIGTNRVFPSRINPGVNRGYLEGTLVENGDNKGKLKNFTAASGSLVYRGNNFPNSFYGMAITPEPAGNLISARYIVESEGELSGELVYPKDELLTSSDERFRPVNLFNAPDGSVYILDMYHGILQHKKFVTTYLNKQVTSRDLDKNNNTMGRIYRLRWKNNPLQPSAKLQNLSALQLVPYLGGINGWERDTARRLIVEKNDLSVVGSIENLIKHSTNDVTIINALWTLYSLNTVSEHIVFHALNIDSLKVQVAALGVAELMPVSAHNKLLSAMPSLINKHHDLALEAALLIGIFNSEAKAFSLVKLILDKYKKLPLTREAVVSGLRDKVPLFMESIGGNYPDADLMYIVNNLGKNPAQITNRAQLSKQGQVAYDLGKQLYNGEAACFGCHGVNGNGVSALGPTFIKSEWVESENILAKVMLHGLMGRINMGWQQWNTSAVMPGFSSNKALKDKDLAAIATYIRNSWGNTLDTGAELSSDVFTKVRGQTKTRTTPYVQKELFPERK